MEVTMRQMSGLGNQLFQYAAGRYYAGLLGAPLKLAVDLPQNQVSHGYARPFLLAEFRIPVPMAPIGKVERAFFSPSLQGKAVAALARATGTQHIAEAVNHRHRFHSALPVAPGTRHLLLSGYWQAWRYPDANAGTLREELALRAEPDSRNRELLAQIAGAALPVSLHVRRGDYTTVAEGNRTLPLDYYRAAVEHFSRQFPALTFFVFSDDLAWCRETLPGALPAGTQLVFVEGNDDSRSQEDLRLMSACRHHVIANSSFSWWGAWLNPRADRQVFAPRFWMLTPDSFYPDLLPPDWTLWPDA